MILARLEEHTVTGTDDFDRPTLALADAKALGHVDGLADRMGVPGGAGTRGEVDHRGADPRR